MLCNNGETGVDDLLLNLHGQFYGATGGQLKSDQNDIAINHRHETQLDDPATNQSNSSQQHDSTGHSNCRVAIFQTKREGFSIGSVDKLLQSSAEALSVLLKAKQKPTLPLTWRT